MKKIPMALICLSASLVLVALGCGNSSTSANDTLTKAIQKLNSSKSYHMAFDATVSLTGDKHQAAKQNLTLSAILPMKLKASGRADKDARDPSDLKFKITNLKFNGLDKLMQDIGSAQGGSAAGNAITSSMINQFFSNMEFSFIKDTFYMKFVGSWFKLSPADMPSTNNVDFSCIMRQAAAGSNSFYEDASAFKNLQQTGEETIDGVSTKHFKMGLNSANMVGQLNQLNDKMGKCDYNNSNNKSSTGTTSNNNSRTRTTTDA